MRRVAAALLALVSAGIVARLGCACSGSDSESARDGSNDGGGAGDVRRDSNAPDVAGDDGGLSSGAPDGWAPFTDYDPSCGFYVPAAEAALPPPIQWQPCDPNYVQPPGIICQQMAVTWTPPTPGYPLGTVLAPAWFTPSGAYVMAIARAEGPYTYLVVAEADGPVHSALLATYAAPCSATPVDLRDGRVVYQVFDSEAKGMLSEYGGGALAANIDDLAPRVLLHYHDQGTRGYNVGLPGVLETTTSPGNVMILHDWIDGSIQQQIWSSAMDQGLQEVPTGFFGGSFLWEATSLPISKIKIWDSDAGARDFIAFGSDITQGAADLWTDGLSMVWLYGSNRTSPNGVYPTVSYMTSPYTTDGAALQPRRLRSETGNAFGGGLTQVGCGYVARVIPSGIRIVRLSDGVSWVLPAQQGSTWLWTEPLAITCAEVFAMVAADGDAGWQNIAIARVRIDSLGPGTPAD